MALGLAGRLCMTMLSWKISRAIRLSSSAFDHSCKCTVARGLQGTHRGRTDAAQGGGGQQAADEHQEKARNGTAAAGRGRSPPERPTPGHPRAGRPSYRRRRHCRHDRREAPSSVRRGAGATALTRLRGQGRGLSFGEWPRRRPAQLPHHPTSAGPRVPVYGLSSGQLATPPDSIPTSRSAPALSPTRHRRPRLWASRSR